MFRLPIVKFFNRIFNRVTITVVLVALQVLWLLWAFWSFTAGRVWLNGALKALSILIVLYLVRKDENSAYKIGWIVLIGLLPLLGGALYLAFGNKAPAKYLRERMQKVEQAHQTELAQPEGQTDALDISSRNLSRYVAKFGPYPAWRDTAAHYFSCGEEMYPQLLADLDKAEKFIFLEFFILRSGKMWDGVEQILRRKAAQGVDVRLIYDDFGSLLGLPMPTMAGKTLSSIASLTSPLALLAIGAGFKGRKALGYLRPTAVATAVKLMALPALFLPVAVHLGFTDEKLVALLVMLGSIATPSCYVMAKQMGHEGVLTGSVCVTTTLFSAFSLTFWLFLLRSMGCIA